MANLSKIKRDKMIAFLEELKKQHSEDDSIRAFNEIENQLRDKKYGLVWEEHSEEVDDLLKENIPVFCADTERRLCKDPSLPWNFIIEGDNLQALYLLEKTHRGKVDCIYIDPPYNTGAKDWKYNNDYVVESDEYRHSKWLSMMRSRLLIAHHLLNPNDSVLICTIDEKEYLHLGCLLEEMFPTATIQMVSSVINVKGSHRKGSFARSGEYLFFVMNGQASPSALPLSKEWLGNIRTTSRDSLRLANMMRFGDNGTRRRAPNCFYPIFITEDGKRFVGVGEPLPENVDRATITAPKGCIAQWPIHLDGSEGCWGYSASSLIELQKKGYLHIGKTYKYGYSAFIIRKLIDCRVKVSDEVDAYKFTLKGLRPKKNIDLMHRWPDEKTHDWEHEATYTKSGAEICNWLIHSYIFFFGYDENDVIDSFYVSSDYDRNKLLYRVELKDWIAYMEFVGSDYIIATDMHIDESKKDYVLTKKERGRII